MTEEKKKSGKFITSILIGGALGSIAAWTFGSKKRRKTISEKVDQVLHGPSEEEKKPGFFRRLFHRQKDE